MTSSEPEQPRGMLTTRTMTMPADTNPSGDIFGGWVLSQMDIAGAICAGERAQQRVVTVALESMSFIRPVKVGDVLCVYTDILNIGRTSVTVLVESWVRRDRIGEREKVTSGVFKFVALNDEGQPVPIPPEADLPDYLSKRTSEHF